MSATILKLPVSVDVKVRMLELNVPAQTTVNNPENQNFEKIKRNPGDIIILHMSTINKNQKSNDVWFLRYWARQTESFLSLDQFLSFYPPPPPPPPSDPVNNPKN